MAGTEATVEEKPVSMAELKSGISLKTGKPIRLIVKDGKGTPRPFAGGKDPKAVPQR